jgi:DNA-binding transcriptional ArsR family regulator
VDKIGEFEKLDYSCDRTEPPMTGRAEAVDQMIQLLDSVFLRALTEPARLDVLRVLILHGPADIGAIAEHLPQDRSVISRHLKTLEEASMVVGRKEGRHRIFEINGESLVTQLETLTQQVRSLFSQCCPPTNPSATGCCLEAPLIPLSKKKSKQG